MIMASTSSGIFACGIVKDRRLQLVLTSFQEDAVYRPVIVMVGNFDSRAETTHPGFPSESGKKCTTSKEANNHSLQMTTPVWS